MRIRNFRCDEQAEPKSLLAGPNLSTREGHEQLLHRSFRNGRTGIDHFQLKHVSRRCADAHRLARGAVHDSIVQEIGEKLGDAAAIGIDWFCQIDVRLDRSFWMDAFDFVDDLPESRLQGFTRSVRAPDASRPRRAARY